MGLSTRWQGRSFLTSADAMVAVTGEAKVTGAYGIDNADYIIHTVGPVYGGEESDEEDSKLLSAVIANAPGSGCEKEVRQRGVSVHFCGCGRLPVGKVGYDRCHYRSGMVRGPS